ncbi:tetraacyldisaccharide 4'-kinase [Pelagibacteraceae bacterium]|nr:tetraacyldisaccharide 4'-kinase [Pelagibacteraceae bacterium]
MKFFKPKFWDKNQISIYSILLFPISLIIQFLNRFKKLFERNKKFSIPVLCVGNIYIGGTGKTPLCIELYKILNDLNKNPVFIKKKYTAHRDETSLLKKIGPICEGPNRTIALENATKKEYDVAILDDGFQDFSIKKDLSIICFNEMQWIGNGFTIPSGPLREDLQTLDRADCVVINGKKNINIENKILEKNKSIKIFYSRYKAKNIDSIKNKKVICFAGIGNPINFFNLLEKEDIKIIEKISFPDHYNYSEMDMKKLLKKTEENKAILLTTEKDYLRINENFRKNINFLKIETVIENRDLLINEIKKII